MNDDRDLFPTSADLAKPPKNDISDRVARGEHLSIVRGVREGEPIRPGNGFEKSTTRLWGEKEHRRERAEKGFLTFGVKFLDDALNCILGGDVILLGAASGAGKCLGIGTPVMLFDGSVIPAEQVRKGDQLMGPDSKPRGVLSTIRNRGPLYRIVPVKGDPWVCNDVHVLTLRKGGTGEFVDIALPDYLASTKTFKNTHKQFAVGVNFPLGAAPEELSVDPYFLGVWIGDGGKDLERNGIRISKPDAEIEDVCREQAAQWGLRVETDRSKSCPTHRLVAERGKPRLELRRALRSACDEDGNISSLYLTARENASRAQLLAGLLDTDGHMTHGGYDIIQKRKPTADGIVFVARSLGLRASLAPKEVDGYGTFWRVTLSGDCSSLPLRIPRKKAPGRRQIKNALSTGFSVEPIGEGEFAGFTLDGDGRFLLGDFTVTHNTELARIVALHNASLNKRVHFLALEADEKEIEQRTKYAVLSDIVNRHIADRTKTARLNYLDWLTHRIDDITAPYETMADDAAKKLLGSMQTFYRVRDFTAAHLEKLFDEIKDETDLVVLDHLQYVDSEDVNENRAYKIIVKKIRDCAQRSGKPVVVVAHLRKADARAERIVPGLEDFYGTSDVGEIVTKAIVVAPAHDQPRHDERYRWKTYIAPVKCRADGSRTRFVGLTTFNARTNAYELPYQLGRLSAKGTKFVACDEHELPAWANPQATFDL